MMAEELKTLKDIGEMDGMQWLTESGQDCIREEAIKEIKRLRKNNKERRYFKIIGKKRSRWVLEQLPDTELIDYIKLKFNVTKEDLKKCQ